MLVESPTYPNMIAALRAHRVRVEHRQPRPGRPAGSRETLLGALRSGRPTLAYLIPEFHNPTGHLMPAALREQLVAAAHRAGTDLVIDESFVDLPADRRPGASRRSPRSTGTPGCSPSAA